MTIRRPTDDPNPVVTTYHGSLMQGTPLEVEPGYVGVLADGARILAAFEPGTHSIPPTPGSARLYFVSTQPLGGVKFGGATSPIAAANGTVTAKRVFGELAYRVTAPDVVLAQLLSHGSPELEPMFAWLRSSALRFFSDELGQLMKQGRDPVFEPELVSPLTERVRGRAGELTRYGVEVTQIGSVHIK